MRVTDRFFMAGLWDVVRTVSLEELEIELAALSLAVN